MTAKPCGGVKRRHPHSLTAVWVTTKENIEIVETYHAGAALPPTKLRKY